MGSPRKVIPIARIARHLAGDTQEAFASRYGVAYAVQLRRELGQAEPPAIARQLYRLVIAAAAVGVLEELGPALDYEQRSEAETYLRLAERLSSVGLRALIPRTAG